MDFDLGDLQASWQTKGASLGRELAIDASAGDAVLGAVRVGLVDPRADLLSIVAAVEAIAQQSPSAAVAYALHAAVTFALREDPRWGAPLVRGEAIGALTLSSADVPSAAAGRLSGCASWVAPVTDVGVAILGAYTGGEVSAFAIALDDPGVTVSLETPAGLRGLACGSLMLDDVEAHRIGPTPPVMARVRVLMAAVGLGIGYRAFVEALAAARTGGGADADEQTVQGLLADAATEVDAARLLTWKSAAMDGELSLGQASVAKLAATAAAQHAVERATQVVGVETFRHGHVIERLAQDVRALELFAGRTEALRSAVAAEILPVTDATT